MILIRDDKRSLTTKGIKNNDKKQPQKCGCFYMATRMRLELTTSSVTGWRSNQLNYRAIPDIKILYM